MTSRRVRRLLILLLDFVGWAASVYLTYTHFAHTAPMCGRYSGCEYVQSSPYAVVLGIPVALLGTLAYTGMFLLALLAFWDRKRDAFWFQILMGLAVAGTLYSAYLTYIEAFVLHAYCLYCVTQAIAITLMTILLFVEWARWPESES